MLADTHFSDSGGSFRSGPSGTTDRSPEQRSELSGVPTPAHGAVPELSIRTDAGHDQRLSATSRLSPSSLYPTSLYPFSPGDVSSTAGSMEDGSVGTPANSSLATTVTGAGLTLNSHVQSNRASSVLSGRASTRHSRRTPVVQDTMIYMRGAKIEEGNPRNFPRSKITKKYSGKRSFKRAGDWVKDYRCRAHDQKMFNFAQVANIQAISERCPECRYRKYLPITSFFCPVYSFKHQENDREARRLLAYQTYNEKKRITTGCVDRFMESGNPFGGYSRDMNVTSTAGVHC